jgi:hypothetical protein
MKPTPVDKMTETELLREHRALRKKLAKRPDDLNLDIRRWDLRREIDRVQGASSGHWIKAGRAIPFTTLTLSA